MANLNVSITTEPEPGFVPEIWLDEACDVLGVGYPTIHEWYSVEDIAHRVTLTYLGHAAFVLVENLLEAQANPERRRDLVRALVNEWGRSFKWTEKTDAA